VVVPPFRRSLQGDSILNSHTSVFCRLALLLLLLIDFNFFVSSSEIIPSVLLVVAQTLRCALQLSEIIKFNFLGYLVLLLMFLRNYESMLLNGFFRHLWVLMNYSHLQKGYGLTETTAGFCRTTGVEESAQIGSVGRLSYGAEAKIVHPETGVTLPPGIPGELWVRGPFVMKGMKGSLNFGNVVC
jgi:acyl-CoA synthetase (AMP-forming)/AMP-acid ligase II